MKVWCIPVNFPHPDKEPEQAEAARTFINALKGLNGVSMNESGMVILAFSEISDARAAKWKLEEFCPVGLELIEGTLTKDGQTLDLHRVVKGD